MTDDGPGSPQRPARRVDDPPHDRQPLLEDGHTVEIARRDDIALPEVRMVRPAPDPGQVLRRDVQRQRPWASVVGDPRSKT